MTETSITFSIVTATCNRPVQLPRALKSVANQTYQEFEHIIVDDASTNPVYKAIEEVYGDKKDKVQYIRHPERTERIMAYNSGLKAVKNDWICFMDDDDEIMPFQL